MIVQFPEALKQFRRNAYMHQSVWRCIIMCDTPDRMDQAWHEVLSTMQGSSLGKDMMVEQARRTITFNNGSTIRMCVVNSLDDVSLRLAGMELTHLIWLGGHDVVEIDFGETRKRSKWLNPEALITHVCTGI